VRFVIPLGSRRRLAARWKETCLACGLELFMFVNTNPILFGKNKANHF